MGSRRGQGTQFRNKNGLAFRTANPREARAAEQLRKEGYEIIRRGWPDLLAYKDGKLRLIEIKDPQGRLKSHQFRAAELLSTLGVDVEIWADGNGAKARSWREDAR